MVFTTRMTSPVQPFVLRAAVMVCAFAVLVCVAAEAPQNERTLTTMESPVRENAVLERQRNVRPTVLRDSRSKAALEKPVRQTAQLESADTEDMFERPRDLNRTEVFPHEKLPNVRRQYVPGSGRSLNGYRVGTRPAVREHCTLHGAYRFRNPETKKPDRE